MSAGSRLATKPVVSWLPKLACSPLNERTGTRSKLAIVGASQIGPERPPLDDPTWDVWGCNSLWKLHLDSEDQFRADDWWEMHPVEVQTLQELQDMRDCPVNLYVLGKADYENWTTYPLKAMRQLFGTRDYYTCTFAYQIALALLVGYKEIGLWGVELWQGSTRERRIEFPCLVYWLGVAQGRGVQVSLPEYSKLLWHEHLYGYDYEEDVKQSEIDDRAISLNWYNEQSRKIRRTLEAKPR